MATYTYDPAAVCEYGVSKARFELGDIAVEGGAETAMLCDEEIIAVLESNPRWKRAMYRLADAVCMRLSYETNWKNDGTSFDLSQRADRWMNLRDKLRKEADMEISLPISDAVSDSVQSSDGGHYFHRGMQKSPYVQPPYPVFAEGDY